MEKKNVTLPIWIDDIPGKGKGLRASRDLRKWDLVAVYSGVVMSSVHTQRAHMEGYYLAAFDGPGVQYTFNVVPQLFAGFGHVLNGAESLEEGENCEMARFLCASGVIFLLRAKREIKKDEELQWNYNGSL